MSSNLTLSSICFIRAEALGNRKVSAVPTAARFATQQIAECYVCPRVLIKLYERRELRRREVQCACEFTQRQFVGHDVGLLGAPYIAHRQVRALSNLRLGKMHAASNGLQRFHVLVS